MSETPVAAVYCANHPDQQTNLRCNRCEKPICPRCAVLTPTGYRCKQCVQSQQKTFETAVWYDYPAAIIVAGGLSFLGSLIATRLGFFTIFLAPGAGMVIAEIVRAIVRRRRGRLLVRLTTVSVAVGASPYLILGIIVMIAGLSQGGMGGLFALLWPGVYAFLVTSAVYYRLSGIQLSR